MSNSPTVIATPDNQGLTLVEMIVALGLGAILLVFVSSSFITDSKYHARVRGSQNSQSLEIALDKKFLGDKFLEKINSNDVADCLLDPCKKECHRQTEWKDIAIFDIPVRMYKTTPDSVPQNDGGFYDPQTFSLCRALPLNLGEPLDAKPRYPVNCLVNLKALGRFRHSGSYEVQVLMTQGSVGISRKIFRRAMFSKNLRSDRCKNNLAVYCNSPDAFILGMDFEKQELTCANPDFEVNYDE